MKTILLSLGLALMIGSCSKNVEKVIETKPEIIRNVSYGSHQRNVADIYLPGNRNTSDTKLMILIHGGGWTDGDKSDLSLYITEMQKLLPNYAFINLNYRLATTTSNQFPAQEEDIKQAVRFFYENREEYQYSSKVVLVGVSAGAHLALLQGYKHADVVQPEAIVSFFAPTDMADMYNDPITPTLPFLLKALTGFTYTQNPDIYNNSSPVNFVGKTSAPTLVFHGGKDEMVPLHQARLLETQLKNKGVQHELVIYPEEGHGWFGTTLQDSFTRITTFLATHVD